MRIIVIYQNQQGKPVAMKEFDDQGEAEEYSADWPGTKLTIYRVTPDGSMQLLLER